MGKTQIDWVWLFPQIDWVWLFPAFKRHGEMGNGSPFNIFSISSILTNAPDTSE